MNGGVDRKAEGVDPDSDSLFCAGYEEEEKVDSNSRLLAALIFVQLHMYLVEYFVIAFPVYV